MSIPFLQLGWSIYSNLPSITRSSPYSGLLPGNTETVVPESQQWDYRRGKWLMNTPFIWSYPPIGMEVAVSECHKTQEQLRAEAPFASSDRRVAVCTEEIIIPDDIEAYLNLPFKGGLYGPFEYRPDLPSSKREGDDGYDLMWLRDWPRWVDLDQDLRRTAIVIVEKPTDILSIFAIGGLGTTEDALKSYHGPEFSSCHVWRGGDKIFVPHHGAN